ncbi:hypothetical protein ACOJBO_05000 [Rhizobium beringeri]
MAYVASPGHHREDVNRAPSLRQCLKPAGRHLGETSQASEKGENRDARGFTIEADWDEDEVREALSAGDEQGVEMPEQEPPVPPHLFLNLLHGLLAGSMKTAI